MSRVPVGTDGSLQELAVRQGHMGCDMPWFPDFVSAVELARRQTRAAGLADPVGEYFTALDQGDTRALEMVWPGEVVIYDPRAGEVMPQLLPRSGPDERL
jgi:hypothetical protein